MLAFRVFRSEQKNDTAHLRIEIVLQTSVRARFLLPRRSELSEIQHGWKTVFGKPERPRKAAAVDAGGEMGGTY
jgi:hypothetical protein